MRLRRLTGFQFRTLSGSPNYESIVKGIAPGSLLAYWPLNELSGLTAYDVSGFGRNGVYSGVTLAQIAGPGPSMGLAPLFDGVNDFCNIFSASLAAAFNGQLATVALWLRVFNAAVWTDGTSDRAINLRADINNTINFLKPALSAIRIGYVAGGTVKSVDHATASTDWLHIAITVSKVADQMIAYVAGVQTGATQTLLGTFAGSLAATTTAIGADGTAATNPWLGYLAHCAIFSTALTPAQITLLATAR